MYKSYHDSPTKKPVGRANEFASNFTHSHGTDYNDKVGFKAQALK